MDFRIGAQIDKQNVRLALWANGVRVFRNEEPDHLSAGEFVNHWLRPGENVFGWDAAVIDAGAEASFELKVMRQLFPSGELEPIAAVDAAALPAKGEARFEVAADFAAQPFWTEADRLTLDEPVRAAVSGELMRLFDAIDADAPDAMIALFAPAFGMDPAGEEAGELKAAIAELGKPPRPAEGELTLELMGDDRLVHVERAGGAALIAFTDPSGFEAMSIPALRYARIGGAWKIV